MECTWDNEEYIQERKAPINSTGWKHTSSCDTHLRSLGWTSHLKDGSIQEVLTLTYEVLDGQFTQRYSETVQEGANPVAGACSLNAGQHYEGLAT
ncbi:hypothetical protein SUGI_1099520 [Cryptomeria japonica]|nr:hypothetical protein SUGI_1099520 [Cryptomeria japonica]